MPDPIPNLTVAPGLDLDQDMLRDVAGQFYLPGETVRLNPKASFIGEADTAPAARRALFGDRTLTVKTTRVDPSPRGVAAIGYTFEEVNGVHGARAFQSPHAEEHRLGVIIRRDGETWFVPFNGSPDREYEVDGPPRRVSSELPRSARYCFDIADPVLLSIQSAHASSGDESEAMVGFENDAAFLAEFETGPAYGEFVLHQDESEGERWVLTYSPWCAEASAKEIAAAEAALEACLRPAANDVSGPGR